MLGLTALVVPLVGILFSSSWALTPLCGGFKCYTNATCNVNNTCQCMNSSVGDGRFLCVDRNEDCGCGLYGDPHVWDFDVHSFALPLTCRYRLLEYLQPQCLVRASVQSEPYQGNLVRTQLHRVDWYVQHQSLLAAGFFNASGVFFSNGSAVPMMPLGQVDAMGVSYYVDQWGFYVIHSTVCDVDMRFRYPVVTARVPLGRQSSTLDSVCGPCGPDGAPVAPWHSLLRSFRSIGYDDFTTQEDYICELIPSHLQNCPASQLDDVMIACALFWDPDSPVASCSLSAPHTHYFMMSMCIQSMCKNDTIGIKVPIKYLTDCLAVGQTSTTAKPSTTLPPPTPKINLD